MSDNDALDFAWHVHGALRDWTGKVDTKASFALTLELAAVGLIISWSASDGPLGSLAGWAWTRYRIGLGLFVVAVLAATAAVIPLIRWRAVRSEWENNYIYFGHLKYWDPERLVATWKTKSPLLALAKQHIVMAKIAWQKHVLLQISLVSALVGGVLIASAT